MPDPSIERTAARADVFRLFAACYYEPAPEFLEEDVFGALAGAARRLDDVLGELAAALEPAFRSVPLLDLQVDYTRLFLSPGGALAPPNESVWVDAGDPSRTQQVMEDVAASYAAAGYQTGEDFKDLPDHIAAELEFLYALVFREAVALANGEAAQRAAAAQLQRAFLQDHLGRWAREFLSAQRQAADTVYYRTLAEFGDRLLMLELLG